MLGQGTAGRSLELKPLLRMVINFFELARIMILSKIGADFVLLWKT
jgi:hypothetical protein